METMDLDPFGGFFRGKRVLITGHTGFKGSWLSLWLTMLGAEATGLALDPAETEGAFTAIGMSGHMVDLRGDIRDSATVQEAFALAGPDIVFHLAAQPLVRESYVNPLHTYAVNVMGTLNVLEAFRNCPTARAGVFVTTDKVYENDGSDKAFGEDSPLGGYDPYSSSKACCEIIVPSYTRSFMNACDYGLHGKALASARAGNVIGGGDWGKDRIIPDCIRALRCNKPVYIRNPGAIRPWQHVLEPLYGYLLLAHRLHEHGPSFNGAWNFGPNPDATVDVGQVVDEVVKAWGSGSWEPLATGGQPHEASVLRLDCHKSRTKLGWRPVLTLPEAVGLTVDWYKCLPKGGMMVRTEDQIGRFCERLPKGALQ